MILAVWGVLESLKIIQWKDVMKIHIEYCEKWNYFPEFERVSNIIKEQNSQSIIERNNSEPRTGSFEVTIEGKLVYSKFETNNFPKESEILNWL